jgi:signal transduction histidine kinase
MTSALRKYLDIVLLIAILPVALVLCWQVWTSVRAERDRTEDELVRAASGFAQSVDRELASSIEALTVLSQSELFQQGRIAAMGRLLHGRPRRDWDSIFLLDANGAVVLDTAAHGSSIPPAAMRELHAQALQKSGAAVSGVTGSPGIAIATAIQAAGHVRYVLGVRTSDAVWTRLATNAPLPPDGQARLYDKQDRAILPASDGDIPETYEAWATVPLAGWRVRVWVPAAPIDAARRSTIIAALSTTGASIVLGLVLAAIAARTIARRVESEARRKDEQVAHLIHETRNGLNAITAAADVLESCDAGSDTATEARSIIARQARALALKLYDLRQPPSP